jgi:glycosyltransferase involved in cell wall biosynthesis
MDRTAKLQGIKIGAFFPWQTSTSSGARTRFNSFWRYLLAEGAQVTLGLLNECRFERYENLELREYTEPRPYELEAQIANYHSQLMMKPGCGDISKDAALFLHLFRRENYEKCAGFAEWAEGIIRDVDVVTIDYPMMVPFLAPLCRKHGKPLLVTAHDALHSLHGNNEVAVQLLKEEEIAAFKLADSLIFVAEDDRTSFGDIHPHTQVVVNTGDVHAIAAPPTRKEIECLKLSTGVGARPFVLFVGSFHLPNTQAAQQLKVMASMLPEIDIVVTGGCWPAEVCDNFKALGYVSEAILGTLYHTSNLVVIPLSWGSGSSLKFFEAMAYGKAILSTTVGVRGHTVTSGREVLISDDLANFPKIIRELLSNHKVRKTLGQAARTHAESIDFRRSFAPYATEIARLGPTAITQCSSAKVPKKRPKLIMVDPSLKDQIGHHFSYAASMREAAEHMGFDFRVLTHQDAFPSIRDAVNGIPCFRYGIHEVADDNRLIVFESQKESYSYSLLKTNEAFGIDLWKGLEGTVGFDDHIFFPNITERQFIGLASSISFSSIGIAPRCHAMLRYPLSSPTLVAEGDSQVEVIAENKSLCDIYRMGFGLLRRVHQDARIRLVTDSERLAREYSSVTDLPIDVVPIPHTSMPSEPDLEFLATIPPKRAKQLRVVYLGDARAEKGFGMLPFSLLALTDRFGPDKLQFALQAFVSSVHHREMAEAIDRIDSFDLPNVHLIKRPLSVGEYQSLLDSADLVILPYNNNGYHSRTSGPCVEALCAGKPVVAPARTWMADQLGDSGAGVLFQEPTDESFFAACVAAIEGHEKISNNARAFSEAYAAYHTPSSFMQHMFGRFIEAPGSEDTRRAYKPEFPGWGYILG